MVDSVLTLSFVWLCPVELTIRYTTADKPSATYRNYQRNCRISIH